MKRINDCITQPLDVLECIVPELLCDVVVTVGVLEGQVELVVSLEQFLAFPSRKSRARHFPTLTVYVNLYANHRYYSAYHTIIISIRYFLDINDCAFFVAQPVIIENSRCCLRLHITRDITAMTMGTRRHGQGGGDTCPPPEIL